MMKKVTLLFMLAMFTGCLMAQKTATIYKASVAPVIDGLVDDVWAESIDIHDLDLVSTDTPPTLGVLGETTWQGLWTDEGLYILLKVEDDVFEPWYVTGLNSWEADKPELYLDVNYELIDGLGPSVGDGHYQVAPAFIDGSNDGTLLSCGFNGTDGSSVDYAFLVDDPTYVAEYFIRFEDLLDKEGFEIDRTADIGFDITVIDRDPGDTDNRNAVWSNADNVNSSWVNMDDCGIIVLDGAAPGVYINSIDLTGGDITENNGTLQIVADILPAEATNKNLLWTVENGTGRASVNSEGIVTGIIDGDVTITALAKDGSWAEASTVVNISGQIVTRSEINLMRNGYFKDVDAEQVPLEWNVSGDTYVNDEGVCVVDPVVAVDVAPNVWDFRLQQQGGWGLNTEDMYEFSFVMWSDEADTFNVDFEDGRDAVDYLRLGTSSHDYGNGTSDWTFQSTTEPVKYVFDVQFENIVEESNEQFQFMLGLHDPVVYIDSVELINLNDLELLSEDYIPVETITISGDSKVVRGETLQLSAAVEPADANLTDVNWKVVPGTGYATIDENGLLSGDTVGSVVVVAMAKDDSEVMASHTVEIGYGVGMEPQKVNTLKVYPNPAVNELNIVLTMDKSRVAIYSSAGILMDDILVRGTEYTLDISNYAAGVYFVKTGKLVTKFVK